MFIYLFLVILQLNNFCYQYLRKYNNEVSHAFSLNKTLLLFFSFLKLVFLLYFPIKIIFYILFFYANMYFTIN